VVGQASLTVFASSILSRASLVNDNHTITMRRLTDVIGRRQLLILGTGVCLLLTGVAGLTGVI
jgi:hypothetical protein